MLPLFLHPLAFVGLLGVPALVAIYLFRNRFRRLPVSSLMLWVDARESRQGGTRLRTLQTPLLFLLELLAILFLVFAAADPYVRVRQSTRPLVVILDDSFSMHAGGARSPREQAIAALKAQLHAAPPWSVRFVVAGSTPRLLGEAARSPSEALSQLDGWRCLSPESRLGPAVALAGEAAGDQALLLVLTDHAPEEGAVQGKGRLQWWSFGQPRENVAFVGASRVPLDAASRCLFEVANLSDAPAKRTFTIERAEGGELHRSTIELSPGQVRRVTLSLPEWVGPVKARLDPDDLPLDDAVDLQPAQPRPVRVSLRLADARLRDLLTRGLEATRGVKMVPGAPDLLVTDLPGDPAAPEAAWVVQVLGGEKPTAFSGPFILSRTHPLTDGLSLRGAVWGVGKDTPELDGDPVVMAGNVALLTDTERRAVSGVASRLLRLRFRLDASSVQSSPDWPILLANLISWRSSLLPGPERANVRVGEQATVNLPPPSSRGQPEGARADDGEARARLTAPGQAPREVPARQRSVTWVASEPGVWKVTAGGESWEVSANLLDVAESDLRRAASGRWGDWLDEAFLRSEFRPGAWLLVLLLLAVACVHLALMRSPRGGEGKVGE
jgi:hypothetical protein